jgi:hypothetical protein
VCWIRRRERTPSGPKTRHHDTPGRVAPLGQAFDPVGMPPRARLDRIGVNQVEPPEEDVCVTRPAAGIPVVFTLEWVRLSGSTEIEGLATAWTRDPDLVEVAWSLAQKSERVDWFPARFVRRRVAS